MQRFVNEFLATKKAIEEKDKEIKELTERAKTLEQVLIKEFVDRKLAGIMINEHQTMVCRRAPSTKALAQPEKRARLLVICKGDTNLAKHIWDSVVTAKESKQPVWHINIETPQPFNNIVRFDQVQ